MPFYSACMCNTLTILSQNEIGDRKGPIAFHRIRKDGFIRKMKSIQILKMAGVLCVGFPAHSLLLFLRLGDYRLREIKCRKHNKARFVFHITLIFFRICHLNQLYFFYIHNHFIIQKTVSRRFHSNRIDQRLYLYGFETTQFWSDFNSKKKLAFNENCNMNRNGQRNQIEWSFTSLLPVLLLAAHCPLFLSINFLQIHSILNYYSVWMN